MKDPRNFLGPDDGFSLVEILIGLAILAGVALAGASLVRDQKRGQRQIEQLQELATYHKNLSQTLSDANNCNATFQDFYDTAIGDISQINYCPSCNMTTLGNDAMGVVSAKYIAEDEWIEDVKGLSQSTRTWKIAPGGITVIPPALSTSDRGVIRVTYMMNPDVSQKTVTKDISINFRYHDLKFKECFNDQESSLNNLQNDMCTALIAPAPPSMARWDTETQTCVVEHGVKVLECPVDWHLEGINVDGSVTCQPGNLPVGDPAMVTPTPGTEVANCTTPPKKVFMKFVAGKIIPVCDPGPLVNSPCTGLVAWATCSATIGPIDHASTGVAYDVSAPDTGSASFSCNNGVLNGPISPVCNVAAVGCPAAPVTWGTAPVCNGVVSAGANGSTKTASDGGSPSSGSAAFTCVSGTWNPTATSTCSCGARGACPLEGELSYDDIVNRVIECKDRCWEEKAIAHFCTPPPREKKGDDEWIDFKQDDSARKLKGSACENSQIEAVNGTPSPTLILGGQKIQYDDSTRSCRSDKNCVERLMP